MIKNGKALKRDRYMKEGVKYKYVLIDEVECSDTTMRKNAVQYITKCNITERISTQTWHYRIQQNMLQYTAISYYAEYYSKA